MPFTNSQRILIIDDDQGVRDSFQAILGNSTRTGHARLKQAASLFFDEEEDPSATPLPSPLITTELAFASDGPSGLQQVREALAQRNPFAVIFVDVRMPGMDGLETVRRIRKLDKQAEIFFVTAYNDYSIEERVAQAGPNVGYICKPFAPEEIRQIAIKGIYDWSRLRDLQTLLELSTQLPSQPQDADSDQGSFVAEVLRNLQRITGEQRPVAWLTHSTEPPALLFKHPEQAVFDSEALIQLHHVEAGTLQEVAGHHYFPFNAEGVLISNQPAIPASERYLLQLFLEQVAKIIENRHLQQQISRLQRLSAMGQASGQIVHDLKQPISVINSAVKLASMNENNPEKLPKYHELIRTSCNTLLDYSNEILEFASNKPPQRAHIDAEDFVANLQEEARLINESVTLQFENRLQESLYLDIDKIKRVLLNLIKNATEAMTEAKQGRVEISLEQLNSHWRFTVTDNGPGIPETLLSQLFEPFVTEGKSQGTGLGLAICEKIIHAHGGSIQARNMSSDASTSGAQFEINLPIPKAPQNRPE